MTAAMGRAKTAAGLRAPRLSERRAAPRVLVRFDVDYRSQDTYLLAASRDLSATGIFVRTIDPLPPGTRLSLRFTPPGASPFELEGQVMWINPFRPDRLSNLDPGMGVRFSRVGAATRARLAALVRRIAYVTEGS